MTTKKKRKLHSPEFKTEVLKLVEKTSVPSAAKELGLQESPLYSWRTAANRKKSVSERESALATEEMALWRRKFPKGFIFHSDRGSQYCSQAFRDVLQEHKAHQSMSRKGDCWDNACVESFFHSLKVEAILYESMMNRDEMKQAVFEYIEVDYNRIRRHSSLGYLSPENYESAKMA